MKGGRSFALGPPTEDTFVRREHRGVLLCGPDAHGFVPYLFPLFSQVFYTLHQLVIVVLERGPLLSHGAAALPCPTLPCPELPCA